jgi:hypothetical protein
MLWGSGKKLAVAVTCSDWRLHQSKVDFNRRIGKAVGCGKVDLVALPGPDGLLLPDRAGEWVAAQAQAGLLANAHHAAALALVAHQRCAGHPVSDPEHETDVAATAKALKSALAFEGPVYALVATYRSDAVWGLKTIGKY